MLILRISCKGLCSTSTHTKNEVRVSGGGSKVDLSELLILEEFIALGLVRISLKTADRFCQSLPTHIKQTTPTRHPSSAPLCVALSNLFQDIEAAVHERKGRKHFKAKQCSAGQNGLCSRVLSLCLLESCARI